MKEEMGVGIIGAGIICDTHAREIREIKGVRLVAVADIVEEKARTFGEKYAVDWYRDYRDLLKREEIDIVNICTPSGLHGTMAIDAARAGKHVIVEKPMDITLKKADAMLEAFRKSGKKLSVISQHRFDLATQQVKREIEAGSLGRLVLAEAAVNWYRPQAYYDKDAWRGTWELDGGGALMNQSIHTIDLLQYLMGPVESIYARGSTVAHERIEVEDVAVATVKFKNGGLGTMTGTTSAYPGMTTRLELFGTEGSAVIENDRLTHFYLRAKEEGGKPVNLAEAGQPADETGVSDPAAIPGRSHREQFIDVVRAIREDREPSVNGAEGRKPLEIILAIYQSVKTGREVHLPLTEESG
ncbi:putative dehydrogenase [Melghirimyces profundicolus]|uniref:Putative dehydrogenase n=1 Tax=Melghirimyces profundicolus TaxID=1242148 RepID=A0A2T6C9F6_9BACL|nr:Gfo/Idh/MocA family oxidoreductase [Melghirimyces profundicolus]PTX64949.1 putative dehydrogenase [Melghirimyces profundicolus]